MTSFSFLGLLAGTLVGGWTVGPVRAQDPATASVRVSVHGYVAHPGKYRLDGSATIEQALAKAGGWNGLGGLGLNDGIPAKWCAIYQRRERQVVTTKFAVSVDRKTRKITLLDATWKNYRLANGDGLEMPGVFF